MNEKHKKLLSLFDSIPEGFKVEDYKSFSMLRRSRGGFSIELIYEYEKHKKKSNSIIIDNIKDVFKIIDSLETNCKNKVNSINLDFLNDGEKKW